MSAADAGGGDLVGENVRLGQDQAAALGEGVVKAGGVITGLEPVRDAGANEPVLVDCQRPADPNAETVEIAVEQVLAAARMPTAIRLPAKRAREAVPGNPHTLPTSRPKSIAPPGPIQRARRNTPCMAVCVSDRRNVVKKAAIHGLLCGWW